MSKEEKNEAPWFQAIGVQVLVEVIDEVEQKTDGGLWLPGTAMRFKFVGKGRVVSVGEGRLVADPRLEKGHMYVPLRVKPGDIVLYPKVQASEVEFAGKKFLVLPEPNIWGVLNSTVDPKKV